jgi:hypothetical protein
MMSKKKFISKRITSAKFRIHLREALTNIARCLSDRPGRQAISVDECRDHCEQLLHHIFSNFLKIYAPITVLMHG